MIKLYAYIHRILICLVFFCSFSGCSQDEKKKAIQEIEIKNDALITIHNPDSCENNCSIKIGKDEIDNYKELIKWQVGDVFSFKGYRVQIQISYKGKQLHLLIEGGTFLILSKLTDEQIIFTFNRGDITISKSSFAVIIKTEIGDMNINSLEEKAKLALTINEKQSDKCIGWDATKFNDQEKFKISFEHILKAYVQIKGPTNDQLTMFKQNERAYKEVEIPLSNRKFDKKCFSSILDAFYAEKEIDEKNKIIPESGVDNSTKTPPISRELLELEKKLKELNKPSKPDFPPGYLDKVHRLVELQKPIPPKELAEAQKKGGDAVKEILENHIKNNKKAYDEMKKINKEISDSIAKHNQRKYDATRCRYTLRKSSGFLGLNEKEGIIKTELSQGTFEPSKEDSGKYFYKGENWDILDKDCKN